MSVSSLVTDRMVAEVKQDVAILKVELLYLRSEIKELKDTNKQLLAFMQEVKAGKAAILTLVGVAATVGSLLGVSVNFISKLFGGH